MGCSGFVTFHSGMSPWGYRGLSWFHCTWHETLYMRHMMLRKEGATACKISIKQTCNMIDLRWFSRFFPSASHQEYRLADLSMTHPKIFAQQPGETSNDYFVSRRQPQPPALPRRILGAEAGRCCMWRLRTARPPWSSSWSLQGPRWTRPPNAAVAPEGFSGRFGSGSVTEGVRTLAADFRSLLWDVEWYSYLLFKDPLLWWDGPLEIRVKEMRWKAEGITWSQSVHWICFF